MWVLAAPVRRARGGGEYEFHFTNVAGDVRSLTLAARRSGGNRWPSRGQTGSRSVSGGADPVWKLRPGAGPARELSTPRIPEGVGCLVGCWRDR